jgi:predicted O-methyltransferase YrrM
MLKPSRVIEVGTYTGYSALSIARGLQAGALLHTIEIDDEIALFARGFFEKSGLHDAIVLHVGDACEIIPRIDETFQLAFIDGDKRKYIQYYELVLEKLSAGGCIIADNVLWDGHVLDTNVKANDHQTRGIMMFNDHVKNDTRVEKVMLPMRDGLTLIMKK